MSGFQRLANSSCNAAFLSARPNDLGARADVVLPLMFQDNIRRGWNDTTSTALVR